MLLEILNICFLIICSVSCGNKCLSDLESLEQLQCVDRQNVTVIRLEEKNLTHLDANMFECMTDLNTIKLGNNQITAVDQEMFKMTRKVNKIDLTGNQLTSIEANTFGELEELKHLHLSSNLLQTIKSKAFHKFPKIKLMEFNHNKLREVAEDAFRINSTIYDLSFRNNSLTNISFVRNLFNLSKLNCASNKIEIIPENIFKNLTKLKDFQCMNNYIRDLNFIKHLTKLERIDLSNNSISNISVTTFANLKELKAIIMSNNKLEWIPTGSFAELNKLEDLQLNNNDLKRIGEIFDKLPNLKWFGLRNNHLQRLSDEIIDNPINFTLYLDGNNWTCPFIKSIANKSHKQIVYTPQNNVPNYKNISCVDEGVKTNPRMTQLPTTNNNTTPSSQEVFQTYALSITSAVALSLGICGIVYFSILLIKRLQASNNKHPQHDIPMMTRDENDSNKYDINGYLEPRQVPCEEAIYEEIDSIDRGTTVHLIPIPAIGNGYTS